MTKRKRSPPPSPKLIGFAIPQSLTLLAQQCRDLRQQAEHLVQGSQDPLAAPADQDLNQAADAQLNAQLHSTIPSAQPSGSTTQPQQFAHTNNATAFRPNAFIPSSSDEEIRQSVIRDAEQQLGMINPSDLHNPTSHMQYNQYAAPQQQQPYFDQQSAQIRFDPYVAPGHQTHYFSTNQLPPSPQTASHQSYSLSSQSQSYNPYPSYVNPSAASSASPYMNMNMNNNAYNSTSGNPYVKIAPGPNPSPGHQPQTALPSMSQTQQPGYYRLQPSYWQAPPALHSSPMTEANQRHHSTLSNSTASSSKQRHDHRADDHHLPSSSGTVNPTNTYNPTASSSSHGGGGHHSHHSHHQSHHQQQTPTHHTPILPPYEPIMDPHAGSGSPYPDPAAMEMAGPGAMNNFGMPGGPGGPGGVNFRNLTKERFGRYSVGGKLVGAGKEIYG